MRKTYLAGASGLAALIAVPTVLVTTAGPANADTERHGSCAGAPFELSVDREHGGFEVDAEIDHATPGSKWRIVLRHDGKRFFRDVRKADHEGEIEVERNRPNTRGKDTFKLTVKRIGKHHRCSVSATLK